MNYEGKTSNSFNKDDASLEGLLSKYNFSSLADRRIREDICKAYGYRIGGDGSHYAPYYNLSGELTAIHKRTKDKQFPWKGNSKSMQLFGQRLYKAGGKRLVITEGELDCLSVCQVFNRKWAVVSVPNGAQSAKKHILNNLEYCESFDEVILAFDNDEAGKEASKECTQLFSPGKVKLVSYPDDVKDMSDLLMARRDKDISKLIFEAETYRPDGIKSAKDFYEDALKPVAQGIPWCWDSLTNWTHGRRLGELYTFGGGTGTGKTDFLTQVIAHTATTLDLKCAVFYLEQPPAETLKRVAAKTVKHNFMHDPDIPKLRSALDDLVSHDNLYLFDHFGATDWEVIKSRIRYTVIGLGCKHVFLDHLTALAATVEDERRALETIMAELAGMCQELNCTIYLISHLSTPEGKSHEEGGRVTIRNFKGSRAIGYWSHFMIGIERHQQADDETERHVSSVRVLKDRYTGQATGKVMKLSYDIETGMQNEYNEQFDNNNIKGDDSHDMF